MPYLKASQQKMTMKIIYRLLCLFDSDKPVTTIFEQILDSGEQYNDPTWALLQTNFIKPQLDSRSKDKLQGATSLLNCCLNKLFPLTLDVLHDKVPHILEMTGRVQAALNLWIFIKQRFSTVPAVQAFAINTLEPVDGLFEHLLKAIVSTEE